LGRLLVSEPIHARTGGRIRPRPLPPGGTIAVVSPASPVLDTRSLRGGQDWLERLGYAVHFAAHFNRRWGYAAGRPEERARDLEAAFANPAVDAVLCAGGGHSTGQLLRHLDFGLIADNSKPFVGFSEITVLHAAIGREAGLVTLWGPMFAQLATATTFTRESMLRALTSSARPGVVDPDGPPARTIVEGIAEGDLVGGTISLLSSLLGTPWEVDTRGRILLLEDVGEEPCRLDRFLTHLLNAGKLEECAGICFAELTGCLPRRLEPAWAGPSLTIDDVFAHVIEPLGVPAIYGLPLGHGSQLATVPLGVRARLDAYAGRLEILESGLSDADA
jgi:muramoyltetrapeptide carboxypeptidase